MELYKRSCAGPQSLIQIPLDIVNLLQSGGRPDQVVANAGRQFFFGRQLLMRGGRRMDHQALGIPDIGQVRDQLESFDEAATGLQPAANAERKNASCPARKIALRQGVITAGWQCRVVEPNHALMTLQELSYRQSVLRVLRHAQFQRLQSL